MLILICLVTAAISSMIGMAKGRNGLGWFFIGFFFPLLGVILASVLPAVSNLEVPPDVQL